MKRLQIVFCLIVFLASVQIVVGLAVARSMSAAADGFHSLFDVVGIAIALVVSALAPTKPAIERRTLESHGGAAIAIVIICTAATLIGLGVYQVLAGLPVEHPWLMLILGGLGVAVNSLALWILHKLRNEGRHLYGAYLHRAGDFFSSALVMMGAGAIIIAETFWAVDVHFLDSVMTFIIALFLVALARRVLRQ